MRYVMFRFLTVSVIVYSLNCAAKEEKLCNRVFDCQKMEAGTLRDKEIAGCLVRAKEAGGDCVDCLLEQDCEEYGKIGGGAFWCDKCKGSGWLLR